MLNYRNDKKRLKFVNYIKINSPTYHCHRYYRTLVYIANLSLSYNSKSLLFKITSIGDIDQKLNRK